MTDCEQYLGFPMVGGKSKVGTFKEILEQITKQVMGWKEKDISKASREILIKTVAQAIPTYSMSIFRILKRCVMVLTHSWKNIGGAKHKMRKKSTSPIGGNYAR